MTIGKNFKCTFDGKLNDGELTEGKIYTGMQYNYTVYVVNNFGKVEGYCSDCFELCE